jgi:hypothetical protein
MTQTGKIESQIPTKLNALKERIEEVQKLTSVLCEKINPILRPTQPPPTNAPVPGKPPEGPLAPLAATLADFEATLARVCRGLGEVLNEIEY